MSTQPSLPPRNEKPRRADAHDNSLAAHRAGWRPVARGLCAVTGLFIAVLASACEEDTWEPSSLNTVDLRTQEPEPTRGAAPSGTARMPNLPAAPDEDQQARIDAVLAQARAASGGGGGGERGPTPAAFRPYEDRFGPNGEGLSGEQAFHLINSVLEAGQNVIGEDVTPCDRLLAMVQVAGRATGDEPVDVATVQQACADMPPEVMACMKPSRDQTPLEQRRCRTLIGQPTFLERPEPEDRSNPPRVFNDEEAQRQFGWAAPRMREEAAAAEPRTAPLRVE